MPRLIYVQDTVALSGRMARRHTRLCGQVPGGAIYAQAMQPRLDNLLQKKRNLSAAVEVNENAYDDLIFEDTALDNSVRTLFERSRQYDRENRGNVSVMLFPDLTFSDIVNMPYSEEPKKVAGLIQKLETLDPNHELRPLAEILQQRVNAVNAALDARAQAAENIRKCQVDVELAKNEVRTQYEVNYLDARKTLGRLIAESLFPKIAKRKTKAAEEDEEEINSEPEE
jgi:hypothetical protein